MCSVRVSLSYGRVLFCVQCPWAHSKLPSDESGMRIGRKRNAEAKGTRSCQERYFYLLFIYIYIIFVKKSLFHDIANKYFNY